jgi:hypothetical protein
VTPGPEDSIPAKRADLDPDDPLPGAEELSTTISHHRELEWIEAGVTVEVLVGPPGWLTIRRRNRVWALSHESGEPSLVARRGLADWNRVLDRQWAVPTTSHPKMEGSQDLILAPAAAAEIVSALVGSFHGSHSVWVEAGPGWDVTDEPSDPRGLAGGDFDDVGFPSRSTALAREGIWVGRIEGPGSYRRDSFKDPPVEAASNLVMGSGTNQPSPTRALSVCRLIRLSREFWVLELETADSRRRWIKVRPEELVAKCAGRLGAPTLTSSGPIVPALRFSGLPIGS